jgi:hypothetical protein
MFQRLFNRVKTDLVRPVNGMTECTAERYIQQASVGVRPSFSASLIEHHDRYRLSEPEMASLAGTM